MLRIGRKDVIEWVRGVLDEEGLFAKGVRCYVYSREDDMVVYEDVESHANRAEKKGWRVRRERFEGSKHVGHMVVDKQRYWRIVRTVWEEGVQQQRRGQNEKAAASSASLPTVVDGVH
jgi:hypothetical protein